MLVLLKNSIKTFTFVLCASLLFFNVAAIAQDYTANGNNKKSGKKTFWNEPMKDRKSPNKPEINYEANVKADMKKYNFDAVPEIRNVAIFCHERWEHKRCYKVLSELSATVKGKFSGTLNHAGVEEQYREPLNNGCADAISARQIEVTRETMHDAMSQCVYVISDINAKTTLKPDVNMYQLMVGSVFCLKGDPACKHIDNQLAAFLP